MSLGRIAPQLSVGREGQRVETAVRILARVSVSQASVHVARRNPVKIILSRGVFHPRVDIGRGRVGSSRRASFIVVTVARTPAVVLVVHVGVLFVLSELEAVVWQAGVVNFRVQLVVSRAVVCALTQVSVRLLVVVVIVIRVAVRKKLSGSQIGAGKVAGFQTDVLVVLTVESGISLVAVVASVGIKAGMISQPFVVQLVVVKVALPVIADLRVDVAGVLPACHVSLHRLGLRRGFVEVALGGVGKVLSCLGAARVGRHRAQYLVDAESHPVVAVQRVRSVLRLLQVDVFGLVLDLLHSRSANILLEFH